MNIKIFIVLIHCSLVSYNWALNESPKTQQAIKLTNEATLLAQDVAQVLFNPLSNPYPTTSLQEKVVDELFGPVQNHLGADTVRYIKNFYFYLEYATKVERAARIAALASQTALVDEAGKPIDFLGLIAAGGWQKVMESLKKKYNSDNALAQALSAIQTPAWSLAIGVIKATSWQNLVASSFWSALSVTANDLTQSMVWQEYISYMITRAFAYDNNLLASINQSQTSMFRYVPDIETVYYHPDYTRLRHMAELFRINLILTDNLRDRYLQESMAWKQYQSSLQKAYEATRVYAQTPLYTYFATAEEQFSQTLATMQQKQLKIPDALVKEPLAIERITLIAMAKNLHALLQPLYTLNNLPDTTAMLNKASLLVPNIMLHAQEDLYLLEDRASLIDLVSQAVPTTSSSSPLAVALRAPSFGVDYHDVIVQSFWSIFEHARESIFHLGKSLAEGTAALACKTGAAFVGTFSKKIANDLKAQAGNLTQKSHADFKAGYQDAMQTIDDIAHTAQDITGGIGKALGFMLGKGVENIFESMGNRTIKGWKGIFQSVTGFALDVTADLTHLVAEPLSSVVCLTLEAVTMTAHFIWDTLELVTGNTKQFNHLGMDLKEFGTLLITTMLDVVTLPVDAFVDSLKDVIKIVSYVVSTLTDIFINVETATAFFATAFIDLFGANLNVVASAQKTEQALEAHRRTLDSIGSTALMIGATVATGGAAAPMVAMIGAQQAFQVIGSYQQDELQAEKLHEEKKFLDAYRIFVNNNKILSQEQQLTWSQELHQKYQAEITNQERNLGFYQNYLNQTFNNYEEQMAHQLGGYLAPKLTPDPRYNAVYADIGSLYGFSTGVYDFNPSQGFSLYSKARNNFSQEIAVAPVTNEQATAGIITENIPAKFWFIQQDTYPMAQAPQTIEVRLRAIYVLTTYHLGLYFGGKAYDVQAIKKNSIAPLDAGHLAKMLVFKKTESAQPTTLGLYQHEAFSLEESKNWLFQAPTPEFKVGSWYRMKMSMSNPTTLLFKAWKEEDPEPAWQQVTVQQQKDPLTTLGIISSGASIEYQILSPEPTITLLHDAQGNSLRTKVPTEKDREANAQLVMHALSYPTLGNFNLTIADRIALLKNQFIYTTANTFPKDYVLLCQLRDDKRSIQEATIGSQLEQLNRESAGVVSVVTGNAYSQSGTQVGIYPKVFDAWLKEHGPLNSALQQAITQAQKSYTSQLLQPVTFGSLALKPTSDQEIRNGQFIYTTTSSQPDFMIFVQENDNHTSILRHNLTYSKAITAALSLVSGNVYDNSTPNKVIDSGYNPQDYVNELEKIAPLRPELKSMIVAAQTAYTTQPTKETTGQNAVKPIAENAVSKNQGTLSGSQGIDTKITTTAVAPKSLAEQQKKVSDDEICFGC